jgi:hypothetical protein
MGLAKELTTALKGRPLSTDGVAQLTTAILQVLCSAGVSTARYRDSLTEAGKALTSLGVRSSTARKISESLENVGKEVRGPEDTPKLD